MRKTDGVIYGLTVDGSKGPAYRLKRGGVVIARECGRPIVLVRTWYRRCLRLDTWDRTAIPLPFNRIHYYLEGPYFAPADADTEAGSGALPTAPGKGSDRAGRAQLRRSRAAAARESAARERERSASRARRSAWRPWPAERRAPVDDSGPVADWPDYGGDAGGLRYSPLTQITRENVGELEVAWEHHSGDVSDGIAGRLAHLLQRDADRGRRHALLLHRHEPRLRARRRDRRRALELRSRSSACASSRAPTPAPVAASPTGGIRTRRRAPPARSASSPARSTPS